MRLIDADKLKKHIAEMFEIEEKYDKKWAMGLKYSLKLIDKSPTVELQMGRMVNGVIVPIKNPTGEWIVTGEEQGALGVIYKTRKCNRCGWENSLLIPRNFCPNCGADMRGEEE